MTPLKISATEAKLHFGTFMMKVKEGQPIIVEKNDKPEMVWISIDDYEDFLELKDVNFQKGLEKNFKQMKKGKFGTLDRLYEIHRKTIIGESQ